MSVEEAAKYLGVPPVQLIRWAGFHVGPPFVGHPLAPKTMHYDQRQLNAWKAARNQTGGG
jgi:hypothetical protein